MNRAVTSFATMLLSICRVPSRPAQARARLLVGVAFQETAFRAAPQRFTCLEWSDACGTV